MLSLDANEWKNLAGGYKIVYDASIPLKLLENINQPDEKILDDIWENLYHQGDVGIASYAAIPQLFRIYQSKGWLNYHLPAFAGSVEEARVCKENPELPEWLKDDYFTALNNIAQYCLANYKGINDKNFSRGLLMLMAILLGERGIFKILDLVEIGEEEKALEIYEKYS